jgi:beta-lactamase regulating signal transducer with metallopeptidase domain
MNLLLQTTLRGAILFALVLLLDRMCCGRMRARSRRLWWWLIPAAFLIPVYFTIGIPTNTLPVLVRTFETTRPAYSAVSPLKNGAGVGVPVFALIWLSGVVIYLALLFWRTLVVSRHWSHERLSTDSRLLNLLEDCKQEMKITAPVGLIVSPLVRGPALLGWIRPRILLPAELVDTLSLSQLRAIFLHELAHARLLDVQLNWIFSLVCAVHWFNPFSHLTFAAWRQLQEEVADEAAIERTNDPSGNFYGEALLSALAQRHGLKIPFGALFLGEPIYNLKRRFHMIRNYAHKTSRHLLASVVALFLIALVVVRPVRATDTGSQDALNVVTTSAMRAATEWDASDYAALWNELSPDSQKRIGSLDAFVRVNEPYRAQLGKLMDRKLISVSGPHDSDGKPMVPGDIVTVKFMDSFEHAAGLTQSLWFKKGADGTWGLCGNRFRQ